MLKSCKLLAASWIAFAGISTTLSQERKKTPIVVKDAELFAWVDDRVKERTPPAEDRRIDEIGWVKDIRHAQQLARDVNRPVFLFTHDGRMNLGRC